MAYPVIFPDAMTHSLVAARLGCREIISAGFISYSLKEGIRCFGKSVSLHKRSRATDSELVAKYFNPDTAQAGA